ncbi:MAG TPA: RsmF rRNA methyltransferase first C-terminal domain-containing protein [Bacillales bacterium]|nr:RsmF rRNA methyltransferase first C-terminal domain-containing protein [Bacillales bacterium]
MPLPQEFVNKMKRLLGNEAEAFLNTYYQEKTTALRVNPLKITPCHFQRLFPYEVEPVPFCPTGFFVNPAVKPGKHPFHQAGLYYMQEPSAMFVAEVVAAEPGEKVLDLSAAPGGKTTQIAGMMDNSGLLVSNDIHPKRARALSENVERMGITNALVTNETPDRLAERFPGYFDRILVDAPCSGEGMFRKDPEACQYWSPEHVESCAARQSDILDAAVSMLREGGTLVYSTCTFSPEENEQVIEAFLDRHSDMEIMPIEKAPGISDGIPEWTEYNHESLKGTARLWPHHLQGEGHFAAKLIKAGKAEQRQGKTARSNVKKPQLKDYQEFEKQSLKHQVGNHFYERKNQLFSLPDNCPDFTGLKVLRPGLHLGEQKKNRFEPNHALAMALKAEDAKHIVELSQEEDQWRKYLHGETLPTGEDRGWMLVTLEGYPLGWGKEAKGTLKNFYPKGLRVPGL